MLDDVPEQTVQTNPYLPVCHTDAASPDEVYPLNDRKLVLYINLLQYFVIFYFFAVLFFSPFICGSWTHLENFVVIKKKIDFCYNNKLMINKVQLIHPLISLN